MTEWNSPGQAERFVSEYADPILRLCLTYSLSREDAQDICQEIFLKLLEGKQQFNDRDHEWVFEDVLLDYPDQTIRLIPKVEVPYAGGTATLTKLDISPLGTIVRVEGGSCYDHHGHKEWLEATKQAGVDPDKGNEVEISVGGFTITVEKPGGPTTNEWFQCFDALEIQLNMKDGSVLVPPQVSSGSCYDGLKTDRDEVPHVERGGQHVKNSNVIPPRVIDPKQVESVTVCGVEIPVE